MERVTSAPSGGNRFRAQEDRRGDGATRRDIHAEVKLPLASLNGSAGNKVTRTTGVTGTASTGKASGPDAWRNRHPLRWPAHSPRGAIRSRSPGLREI